MRISRAAVGFIGLLTACGGPEVEQDVSLPPLLSGAQSVVGVTHDPVDGAVYMLGYNRQRDQHLVFRYQDDASADVVVEVEALVASPPLVAPVAFTDIASLGNGRFAVTAENNGYLLDVNRATLTQHFCYLPSVVIDETWPSTPVQISRSVAFDPARNELYVQPRTTVDGDLFRADVAVFDADQGGEGDRWLPLDDVAFHAGAITVAREGELWMGQGATLSRFSLASGRQEVFEDLRSIGVENIEGLSAVGDRLYVIDGSTQTLKVLRF